MPRPRNDEIREKVLIAFWKSFQEEGYEAASYGRIAKELKINKALVQYHYPKKEQIAIALMERLLSESEDVLHIDRTGNIAQDFASLYRIGQTFFAFLLQKKGYRQFLYDVIKSRDLTEDVLAFDLSWALQFVTIDIPDSSESANADVDRSVILRMGGFYELLYHCLKNDLPFDVSAGLNDVLVAFIVALGYTKEQATEFLAPGMMDEAELESAVSVLNERLLF